MTGRTVTLTAVVPERSQGMYARWTAVFKVVRLDDLPREDAGAGR